MPPALLFPAMSNAPDSAADSATILSVTLRTREAARLTDFHRGLLQIPEGLIRLELDPCAVAAPPQAPGLFHVAIVYPQVEAWAAAVQRALAAGTEFHGASDHAVSWAAYFADPDGNGLELAWDTPREQWPWRGDQVQMVSRPLPLRRLLSELPPPPAAPEPARIGHVHLQVADLHEADAYCERLDLRVTQADLPGARFLARGDYHHHLALNTWRTERAARRPDGAVGLIGWEMTAGRREPGTWIDASGQWATLAY